MAIKLLDGATGADTSSVYGITPKSSVTSQVRGIVQAIISVTSTVALQGSLDNSTWFTIKEFTASDASDVALTPFIRAKVTTYGSGSITVMLIADPQTQLQVVV